MLPDLSSTSTTSTGAGCGSPVIFKFTSNVRHPGVRLAVLSTPIVSCNPPVDSALTCETTDPPYPKSNVNKTNKEIILLYIFFKLTPPFNEFNKFTICCFFHLHPPLQFTSEVAIPK